MWWMAYSGSSSSIWMPCIVYTVLLTDMQEWLFTDLCKQIRFPDETLHGGPDVEHHFWHSMEHWVYSFGIPMLILGISKRQEAVWQKMGKLLAPMPRAFFIFQGINHKVFEIETLSSQMPRYLTDLVQWKGLPSKEQDWHVEVLFVHV